MTGSVLIIQGHPDPAGGHFCHALAAAYAEGAREGGHAVHVLDVSHLEFPWLQTKDDFEHGTPCAAIREAQDRMRDADHLVIIHPLWLGEMPARLKAFFEQVLRPGFAFSYGKRTASSRQLQGKSARIVITMGMPPFVYRWYFGAHGLKNLKRGILGFCGIRPVRSSLIGNIEGGGRAATARAGWLASLRDMGRKTF